MLQGFIVSWQIRLRKTGLTILPDLHDGFFDCLWISAEKCVRFFVRTVTGERFTIILTGAEALKVCSFRAGKIILDLVLIAPNNLTVENMEQAYDLRSGDIEMARQILGMAKEQGLSALEINPSYGAEGTVIFRSVAIDPSPFWHSVGSSDAIRRSQGLIRQRVIRAQFDGRAA